MNPPIESRTRTQNEAIVEVDSLITHYGDRKILKDVSFSVKPSEIIVIMGGSGSGKSTLLRHLLALEYPTSGIIKLLGQDITRISAEKMYELRRNMGVAFQGGALFGSMTVGENIMLPLQEHTRLDEKTMQIMVRLKMELVNLAGFEHLMPAELSGGMLKRAALARAMVMDPKILFVDEPSAGLDPVAAAELDEMILGFRDALNMTLVVVTHELNSAFKIADRIIVLDQGEVLVVGTVEEVKKNQNQRVQDLLNRRPSTARPDPEQYLERLTGNW